jgi:two-component sensor histidine kinase
MLAIIDYLFGAASFLPHGYCLLWRPDLIALHAVSDGLIALAYFSIPVALAQFVRRRPDLQFGWMFWLFAAFILACGITHLAALVTLWQPFYGLQGLLKAATAVISLTAAALLWPLVPRAIAIPGAADLRRLNEQLASGIAREREAATSLKLAVAEIEQRVGERTRQLAQANERLRGEIRVREKAEEQQDLLLAELRHRVRNTLAIVKSIAMQTRQHSRSMDEFSRSFEARVQALADTHTLLFESNWTGSDLSELIRQHLRPYCDEEQAKLAGPALAVRPRAALSLSLMLHELAVNAAKYGALSTPSGWIEVEWRVQAEEGAGTDLELIWRERGGPPAATPARRGFGSEVIELTVALEFRGQATFDYRPDGLVVRFTLPVTDGGL